MKIYIDIETGPAANYETFRPIFEAPRNIKDPAKISAAVEEKQADWHDRLALSAITGRVLAVGIRPGDSETLIFDADDEKQLLWELWTCLANFGEGGGLYGGGGAAMVLCPKLVGWNLVGFDLPFLQRRSWAHDVPTPAWVFPRGRLSNHHIDLLRVWCGENPQDKVKLDTVSRWLGLGGKTDPAGGKQFAKLWEADRERAIAYLKRDVELTAAVAKRMGEA